MLAMRSPPGSKTDREFLHGIGTLDDQFGADKIGLDQVLSGARQHGYTPSVRDFYCEPLARFPGDPEAFIKTADGRGHVKKVCEQRGLDCRGAVNANYYRNERDNPLRNPKKQLADVVVEHESKKIANREKGKKHDKRELRERVIEKHSLKIK